MQHVYVRCAYGASCLYPQLNNQAPTQYRGHPAESGGLVREVEAGIHIPSTVLHPHPISTSRTPYLNMPFPPTPSSPDKLTIKDLSLHLPHGLGPSAFNLLPPPPCPAILNVEISLDPRVVPSSTGDDTMAGLGLNYSSTTNAIRALCEGGTKWASPRELLDGIAGMLWGFEVVTAVKASVGLPRGVLPAERVVYTATYARPEGTAHTAENTASGGDDTEERGDAVGRSGLACTIKALRVRTIIGLHAHERRTKQWLEVDVTVKGYDEATWSHVYFAEEVYEVSR